MSCCSTKSIKSVVPKKDLAVKVEKFLLAYGGRDKVSKLAQYVGIVGDAYLAQSNPELASQFKALGAASGASRKYWRLGRFVYEYNAIVKLTKESSMSPFDKLLAYTAKMSWGYYWFWDNITYLSKLGVLKHDKATINKMAIESARGWLYGCGVEMLKLAILLAAEYRKLKNLQKALKSSNTCGCAGSCGNSCCSGSAVESDSKCNCGDNCQCGPCKCGGKGGAACNCGDNCRCGPCQCGGKGVAACNCGDNCQCGPCRCGGKGGAACNCGDNCQCGPCQCGGRSTCSCGDACNCTGQLSAAVAASKKKCMLHVVNIVKFGSDAVGALHSFKVYESSQMTRGLTGLLNASIGTHQAWGKF